MDWLLDEKEGRWRHLFQTRGILILTCYGVNYDITYRLCFINISLYYWETTQMGFASVLRFSGMA